MIYVIIGVIIILFAYVEAIVKSQKVSDYIAIGLSLALVLFAGLRDKTGTDWLAYFEFFKEKTDRVEIGYAFLNNIFSDLGVNYNLFLIFINFISLALMYIFLRRNAYFVVIGLLIFYCDLYLYFNLSGIRQAVAMAFTCYSINFAINRQFFRFLLTVAIAGCFHLTALLFVIAYFLPRKALTLKHIIASIIVFGGFALFLNSISELITLYTLKDANYYVNTQEKAGNLLSLFYVGIAKRFVIVGVILVLGRDIFKYSNFQYFFNIYIFGLAIYISTYMVSPDIGVRLSSYFTIFDVILAGNLIYVIKDTKTRLIVVSVFASIALYKLLGYMNDDYYTYHLIFTSL